MSKVARPSFTELETLLENNPNAYLAEVRRLRDEDPPHLERFVSRVHARVAANGHIRRRASIRALVLADVGRS